MATEYTSDAGLRQLNALLNLPRDDSHQPVF